MNAFTYDKATFNVLWKRDLKRFLRQPSRVVGALGQPLIFWLVIGSGMTSTFKLANTNMPYLEFFYPGVLLMILLFASIFASVSIIEDRHQGFLQAVLCGPGSRQALVLGKCTGSMMVALIQAGLFLCLLPFAGFHWQHVDWALLLSTMILTSLGLTAFGFFVAWWIDNLQGYHAIQMTLLIPLWILSGAMFPPNAEQTIFYALMTYNPIAYSVTALRQALYGNAAPVNASVMCSTFEALSVLSIFTLSTLTLAYLACRKR